MTGRLNETDTPKILSLSIAHDADQDVRALLEEVEVDLTDAAQLFRIIGETSADGAVTPDDVEVLCRHLSSSFAGLAATKGGTLAAVAARLQQVEVRPFPAAEDGGGSGPAT